MDETNRSRGERVLERFPKEHVRSRREMAKLLSKYRWLLDAIAHQHLGETPDAQEAANAVVARMLALEEPDMPHALRVVTQALRNECYRRLRERARPLTEAEQAWAEGIPFDPVLKRVTEAMAVAAADLPQTQRIAFELASRGVSVADIAAALEVPRRTVTMRLLRARRQLRPLAAENGAFMAAGLLGLRKCWHRVVQWSAHLRALEMRGAAALDGTTSLAPQLVNATVLVSLVAWALGPSTPPTVPGPGISPQVFAAAAPAMGSFSTTSLIVAGSRVTDHDVRRGAAPTLTLPELDLLPSRGGTPADTHLLAATPAPDYQDNHIIVALGQDPACECLKLFQSTDGGHQWAATSGPASGTQVALPPDYPTDPRVFIGNTANLAGASDFVADHFGGTYTPLAGPPGFLALSGDFDDGDPEVYVATTTGVTSIDMTTGMPSATVLSTGSWGLASLATSPNGPGVLAAIPPGSLVPSGLAGASSNGAADSVLFGCHARSCSRVADIGNSGAQILAVSSTYGSDHALVIAYKNGRVAVSTAGGASFEALQLPPDLGPIGSVAVASGRVWITTAGASGGVRIGWVPAQGGAWHDVTSADPMLRSPGVIVAIGGERLLYLAPAQGFRCSADGGGSWATACPASE